ncbi:MAG: heat-inducible transcriptional repressor HrcA [Dehalococcoidales bacterium]|nr:heat-inducible transcriptional repressor HrcA [Dehalococcoidales bacterium]
MLSPRAETILKSIVGQYIAKAKPVPSQSIMDNYELKLSSATIRNEMAHLEQEGYIIRAHPSAGSIPSDKGYRCYVESLGDIKLPLAEQRLVSHLFHQVEKEVLDEWLNLAATLIAQMVHNAAVVTIPKPKSCQFKHLELVSLQDYMGLIILVLSSVKIRQQLVTFSQVLSQEELTAIANKLTGLYSGLTRPQMSPKDAALTPVEQQITDSLTRIMEDEDNPEHERQYTNGLHFTINQPEFSHGQRILTLIELIEQRNLLKLVALPEPTGSEVRVIIGKENRTEAIQDYSIVVSQYGLPDEAIGTICVIGPTRMPYAHTIATVDYLSLLLSRLASRLYGKETSSQTNPN